MKRTVTTPEELVQMFRTMADDNRWEAARSFWPWTRTKYRSLALAFEAAAEWRKPCGQ